MAMYNTSFLDAHIYMKIKVVYVKFRLILDMHFPNEPNLSFTGGSQN